jgi:hypothetical protein
MPNDTAQTSQTDYQTPPIPNSAVSGQNQVPPPAIDLPPVITTPPIHKENGAKKMGGKKLIATILGILILIGGVATGVYLTQQQQDIREKARQPDYREEKCEPVWSQGLCNPDGTCKKKGQCLGCCPGGGGIVLKCLNVEAYKVNGSLDDPNSWQLLTTGDYSSIKPGQDIYFLVKTSSSPGRDIDKAKFSVNGGTAQEGIEKDKHLSDDGQTWYRNFYYKYTIPPDVSDFTVKVQLHNNRNNSWF